MSRTMARPEGTTTPRDLPALALYVLAGCGLAVLGAATVTSSAGAAYARGPQVEWQPPIVAVEAVWTALFLASAVAGWLVHRRRAEAIGPALWLYWAMVGLEALWLALFLLHAQLWLVLGVILVLDLVAAAAAFAFWRASRTAGVLLSCTVAWLLFGTMLSIAGAALRAP